MLLCLSFASCWPCIVLSEPPLILFLSQTMAASFPGTSFGLFLIATLLKFGPTGLLFFLQQLNSNSPCPTCFPASVHRSQPQSFSPLNLGPPFFSSFSLTSFPLEWSSCFSCHPLDGLSILVNIQSPPTSLLRASNVYVYVYATQSHLRLEQPIGLLKLINKRLI